MNASTIQHLIRDCRFDICQDNDFNPYKYIYSAKGGNRCVKLFKILLSSDCRFDCSYCPNGKHRGRSITPEELSRAFFTLRRKGKVTGAFISSAVDGDSQKVMDDILRAGELIRERFKGYLHLKVMPGANRDQIRRALELASRVSINVETTSNTRMKELSSVKDLNNDIMRRERWISDEVKRCNRDTVDVEKESQLKGQMKLKSHTTQLIAGVGESDEEIIDAMQIHYRKFEVARMYMSPFRPVKDTPMAKNDPEDKKRVANLYRADALVRIYGYDIKHLKEILVDGALPCKDPKELIAQRLCGSQKLKLKPIQIPGIGKKGVELLEEGYTFADLKKMGYRMRKAAPYLPSQSRLNEFG
ncbi:MAG: radical SAM protein [Archaeoglobaceae archaeon]